jgi:cardiolipin synthase
MSCEFLTLFYCALEHFHTPETGNQRDLFPTNKSIPEKGTRGIAQVMAGGPIYPMSTIILTYFRIFTMASNKLYITNPYFLPSDSIPDALKQTEVIGV